MAKFDLFGKNMRMIYVIVGIAVLALGLGMFSLLSFTEFGEGGATQQGKFRYAVSAISGMQGQPTNDNDWDCKAEMSELIDADTGKYTVLCQMKIHRYRTQGLSGSLAMQTGTLGQNLPEVGPFQVTTFNPFISFTVLEGNQTRLPVQCVYQPNTDMPRQWTTTSNDQPVGTGMVYQYLSPVETFTPDTNIPWRVVGATKIENFTKLNEQYDSLPAFNKDDAKFKYWLAFKVQLEGPVGINENTHLTIIPNDDKFAWGCPNLTPGVESGGIPATRANNLMKVTFGPCGENIPEKFNKQGDIRPEYTEFAQIYAGTKCGDLLDEVETQQNDADYIAQQQADGDTTVPNPQAGVTSGITSFINDLFGGGSQNWDSASNPTEVTTNPILLIIGAILILLGLFGAQIGKMFRRRR